jgi:hypothetical protein
MQRRDLMRRANRFHANLINASRSVDKIGPEMAVFSLALEVSKSYITMIREYVKAPGVAFYDRYRADKKKKTK